jgi:hypothetical protein
VIGQLQLVGLGRRISSGALEVAGVVPGDHLPIWFREAPTKQWVRPQAPGRTPPSTPRCATSSERSGTADTCSLISFFAVPKGTDDVRMVYDGTKSGLNTAIWVPRFPLPTVNTMLRAVGENTFMGDMDIGEMFLNFVLHESMQALSGEDLTEYFGKEERRTGKRALLWEKWVRCAMRLKSSPCQAIQAILVAKEFILGDRSDPKNVFRWDEVRMNLPGSASYDPTLPWVSKVRLDDGKIAADLFIYVDDVRVTGNTAKKCDAAVRRAASTVNWLGVQDVPRKQRFRKQAGGAWAGSVVETDGEGVYVTVSQEKWDKSKRYIGDIVEGLSWTQMLNHKDLERK